MSIDIYLRVKRGGTFVASIPTFAAQLDLMSQQEASYYSGASPYTRHDVYILAIYDIRQEDLLVDTRNIDPKTNTFEQYRVINDPEKFPDQHMEAVVDRVRGT